MTFNLKVSAQEFFISCLLEMAAAETNPVLEIIDINKPLEENKKYPVNLLQFNQTGWRAYYHCHPASRAGNHRFKGEHGHFHIFVRTQTTAEEEWSHLVALAIDNMGQPLGWFTVNHWVTGEHWQPADILIKRLNIIPYNSQQTLIERWLLSFLALDNKTIREVLYERDNIIEHLQKTDKGNDIRLDKTLYLLSEAAIDLKELVSI